MGTSSKAASDPPPRSAEDPRDPTAQDAGTPPARRPDSVEESLATLYGVLDDIISTGELRLLPESRFPDATLPLARSINSLIEHLQDLSDAAKAISHAGSPSDDNAVLAPLEDLHSRLFELAGQGDDATRDELARRLSLSRGPSETFHAMMQLLAEREAALIDEIARREDAERRLKLERDLLAAGPVITFRWGVDDEGTVQYVSPNVGELGYSEDDFIGGRLTYGEIIHPDDYPWVVEDGVDKSIAGLEGWTQGYRIIDADGKVRWIRDHTHAVRGPDGELACYEGYIIDVTPEKQLEAALREREEQLRVLSLADELTGLSNRRGLFALGEQALRSARRHGRSLTIIYADIDGLRNLNERFGHDQGDTALHDVADALCAVRQASDIAARASGDELVLLIDDEPATAARAVQRVRRSIDALNDRGERPYRLSVSIGVTHVPADSVSTLSELIELTRRRAVAARGDGDNP